jgi:hypothetical protein
MMIKLGNFGNWIRSAWKCLKCGIGEGWERSVGLIMQRMKKCYEESRRRGTSCKQQKRSKANWVGYILRRNCFLQHVIK